MSIAQLKVDFANGTSVEQIVSVVNEVIGDVINNVHPTTMVLPGVTVMELREVSGFYQDSAIVKEMTSMYIGRLMKGLLDKYSLNSMSVFNDILPIMMSSESNEFSAVSDIVDQCTVTYGKHTINKKHITKVLDKIAKTVQM